MGGLMLRETAVSQGRKTGLVISLSPEERRKLESWQRSRTIRTGLQRRGRVLLLLADSRSVSDAARAVGMQRRFVYRWAQRFLERRLEGLDYEARRSRGEVSSPPGGPQRAG